MNNKTDILIPLGAGSRHDNIELQYCLRSIEKHLKDVRRIFIIGECPEWLTGVTHLEFEESLDSKQRAHNIYSKIMAGISSAVIPISDNFLFFNDDHFLLNDFNAGEFPYYYRGYIDLKRYKGNIPQTTQMNNTINKCGIDAFDFDIHCPISYNKTLFKEIFEEVKWPEYGYGIKSMYANSMIDTSEWIPTEDLKFHERISKEKIYKTLEGRSWFSIGDRVLLDGSDMKEVLQELYPNKSKYEL